MIGYPALYPATVGVVFLTLGTLLFTGACGKKGAPLPPLESPRKDSSSPPNVEQDRRPLPPLESPRQDSPSPSGMDQDRGPVPPQ
jgi:hypothetical protein